MSYLFKIAICIFLFISVNTFAKTQIPNKIIYKEKEYALLSEPLEEFFIKNPEKRPKGIDEDMLRGYAATFEIKENQLFLTEIEIRDTTNKDPKTEKWKSVFTEVFPNQEKVKLEPNRVLVLTYGNAVIFRGPFAWQKNILLLEMSKGLLIKEQQLEYAKYKVFNDKLFKFLKKNEVSEYEEIKEKLISRGLVEKNVDELLRLHAILYTSKIFIE
jgi:hypothetical protein